VVVGQGTIRIGTRGSALALEQARRVVAALQRLVPTLDCQTRVITTRGDLDQKTPLTVLGGQGIFAKELQSALLDHEIDLAVHSVKDLTSERPEGLTIGAVPGREDPRDVLVSRDGRRLSELPPNARVGTSSRRRMVQLHQARPDVQPVDFRGNIDTRLRKVRDAEVDAAILAAAGILRMGWGDRITEYLPIDDFVPAPGQGAIGVECRSEDTWLIDLLAGLNDRDAALAVSVERAYLQAIGGGCSSPIGAHAVVDGGIVRLRAMLADESMTHSLFETRTAPAPDAPEMARQLAGEMKQRLLGQTDMRGLR
jgi:hydroxymethylbilane synthase